MDSFEIENDYIPYKLLSYNPMVQMVKVLWFMNICTLYTFSLAPKGQFAPSISI